MSFAAVPRLDTLSDMPDSDHFTTADRERLTECTVNLQNLQRSFERLENTIADRGSPTHIQFEKLEARVRGLENFRWWIAGAAIAGGAASHFLSHLLAP